ncbi:MAG: hypothetical protein KA045_01640 [Burkholderiaceae bacterium]|nr:hypothetical protein [Burkholderiaceae bacterium]
MSHHSDLVHVVDCAALIENILNQIIEEFCEPRKDRFNFFWNVVLDSSIMPIGSKLKVVSAIAQELDFKLAQDSLHKVMALRNAFAHHKTGSHPIISVGKTEGDSQVHYELQVLNNSGKLFRKRRDDALSEFNEVFLVGKESLLALKSKIKASKS